jgi:hypothetical protein
MVEGVGDGGGFFEAQSSGNSYQHAMRAWYESVASAEHKYNRFIQRNFDDANSNSDAARAIIGKYTDAAKWRLESAITYLGKAQHPIADSTSPAHSGFQIWFGIPDGILILGPVGYAAFVEVHHNRESPSVYALKRDAAASTVAGQVHSELLDILRE